MIRRCTTLIASSIVALAGHAQGAPELDVLTHTPAPAYEGQSVVRATTDSARELNAALTLAEGVWSERIGVGPIELQIMTDRIAVLEAAGVEVEVLIPDLQARAEESWRQVQETERAIRAREAANPRPRGVNPHDETWFENYKQLAQIESYINGLATARPDLASVSDIGDSIESRDILAITITGPDQPGNASADRPVILFNGCQHAREWVSPMTVTYLASRMVGDYDSDSEVRDLLDSVRFVIVPVANPDGYAYSWSDERFWRKNRRNNGDGTRGVDLNRNWGFEWGGEGASPNSNSDTYHGTGAFSEPETDALRVLSESFGDDLVSHIDYHSFSQLILWPFGYDFGVVTPEPDRSMFIQISGAMSDEILSFSGAFYDPIQSVDLYPAAGDSSDWFYGDLGATSFTVELRPSSSGAGGFAPDPSEILPTARENWEAAKVFGTLTTARLGFDAQVPATVAAGVTNPVDISITNISEMLDASSLMAFASIAGGSFESAPIASVGGGDYRVTLPAASCGESISFYVEAQTVEGSSLSYPAAGASGPLTTDAVSVVNVLTDDIESDSGWSVGAPGDSATTGVWERANPQGTEAQPEDDRTPGGTQCWITEAQAGASLGSFDIDGGATTLTSPALDASGLGDAQLSYWRWYSNNTGAGPNADSMLVQISDDNGASWTELETVTENAGAWVEKSFRVTDFVDATDQLRVRFVASDLGDGSIVEAGVDDLRIDDVACPGATADLAAPFGVWNFFDLGEFLTRFNANDLSVDYAAPFGTLNFFDLGEFLTLFNAQE